MHKISEFKDITPKIGYVLARSRSNALGVILRRTKGKCYGRTLLADEVDCEYRITCVKNARLGGRWESKEPYCIGFLPTDEVKCMLKGETVTRI